MNIQLSVVIWTIICFSILMLILHNWLFKPVLAMFDRRKEKIDSANKKKAENERHREEHQKLLEEQNAVALKKQKEEKLKAIAQIQSDNRKQMEDAKKEHLENVEMYRSNIETQYNRMIQVLANEMQYAAEALAERIISHKVD